MSEHTNYCTGKGLFTAVTIVMALMIGVPYLTMYAVIGHDEYARQCKTAITLPCIGVD